jgi:hypothetical protein
MGHMPPPRPVRDPAPHWSFAIASAIKLRFDAEALRGKVGQIFENLEFSAKNRGSSGSRFCAPQLSFVFNKGSMGGGPMGWGTQAEGWCAKRAYRRDRRKSEMQNLASDEH